LHGTLLQTAAGFPSDVRDCHSKAPLPSS
jgi:hypothetical protein